MSFIEEIKALEQFEAMPRVRKSVVFYSEGPEYWPHYRGIIGALLSKYHCPCIYVSSSGADPGLSLRHPLLRTLNIGAGGSRVNLFKDLDAGIMVLTMPDLGALALKRSLNCGNYVYVFHSPVSTHMIYRADAFDHYDTVFCVGPHHEREIRQRERNLNLPAKRLFQHGYGRLDDILTGLLEDADPGVEGKRIQVLVAPSWGAAGVFETIGEEVVECLLAAGFRVVARPHPQTVRMARARIDQLAKKFSSNPNFTLELDMSDKTSFLTSDVLVSDWSGAAFDFAFARLRPVVFIDVPHKINNPAYQDIAIVPLEIAIRPRIGKVVAPGDSHALVAAILSATSDGGSGGLIEIERQQAIYNTGNSAIVAAAELARLAFNQSLGDEGSVPDVEARCWAVARSQFAQLSLEPIDGGLATLLSRLDRRGRDATALDTDHLEAVCRRIDVFKSLHTQYDATYQRPAAGAAVAPLAIYPLLILVLIQEARHLEQARCGLALKYLNSAGNALDQYIARGGQVCSVALESLLGISLAAIAGGL